MSSHALREAQGKIRLQASLNQDSLKQSTDGTVAFRATRDDMLQQQAEERARERAAWEERHKAQYLRRAERARQRNQERETALLQERLERERLREAADKLERLKAEAASKREALRVLEAAEQAREGFLENKAWLLAGASEEDSGWTDEQDSDSSWSEDEEEDEEETKNREEDDGSRHRKDSSAPGDTEATDSAAATEGYTLDEAGFQKLCGEYSAELGGLSLEAFQLITPWNLDAFFQRAGVPLRQQALFQQFRLLPPSSTSHVPKSSHPPSLIAATAAAGVVRNFQPSLPQQQQQQMSVPALDYRNKVEAYYRTLDPRLQQDIWHAGQQWMLHHHPQQGSGFPDGPQPLPHLESPQSAAHSSRMRRSRSRGRPSSQGRGRSSRSSRSRDRSRDKNSRERERRGRHRRRRTGGAEAEEEAGAEKRRRHPETSDRSSTSSRTRRRRNASRDRRSHEMDRGVRRRDPRDSRRERKRRPNHPRSSSSRGRSRSTETYADAVTRLQGLLPHFRPKEDIPTELWTLLGSQTLDRLREQRLPKAVERIEFIRWTKVFPRIRLIPNQGRGTCPSSRKHTETFYLEDLWSRHLLQRCREDGCADKILSPGRTDLPPLPDFTILRPPLSQTAASSATSSDTSGNSIRSSPAAADDAAETSLTTAGTPADHPREEERRTAVDQPRPSSHPYRRPHQQRQQSQHRTGSMSAPATARSSGGEHSRSHPPPYSARPPKSMLREASSLSVPPTKNHGLTDDPDDDLFGDSGLRGLEALPREAAESKPKILRTTEGKTDDADDDDDLLFGPNPHHASKRPSGGKSTNPSDTPGGGRGGSAAASSAAASSPPRQSNFSRPKSLFTEFVSRSGTEEEEEEGRGFFDRRQTSDDDEDAGLFGRRPKSKATTIPGASLFASSGVSGRGLFDSDSD